MTRNYPKKQAVEDRPNAQIAPVPGATIPYWRTQLHRLDEHRSTPDLPSESDIVIIGCGMSGVSTAYHLLNLYRGSSIPSLTLLDARQVCSGATGRNGGHCKVQTKTMLTLKKQFGLEVAHEFAAFVHNLTSEMKDIVERERLDCEFELRRSFDVFLDDDEARAVEAGFYTSLANGEEWVRWVDIVPKEFVEQVTSIRGAKTAFSVPACSLWPYKFVTQLLERIIEDVNLQTNTMVTAVRTDEDSNVQVVETSRGQIRAGKVIFASNAYTAGISSVYERKIVPYVGTNSHLRPAKPVSPHLTHTYNLAYGPHVDYLNPRPDGGVTVGGAKSQFEEHRDLWYNNWNDSQLLPNVDRYFDKLMQRNFKGWENSGSKLDHLWTGIMGLTADGMPHIGEVPGMDGKQFVLAGFNGGGMSLIFSCARGLAKMVKDGVPFGETGMPRIFQTSMERLEKSVDETMQEKRGADLLSQAKSL